MKNLLQAHSANATFEIKLNPLLRKELAKIKVLNMVIVSTANLQHKTEAANMPRLYPPVSWL